MTQSNRLVQQNILKYESCLKHVDEMIARVAKAVSSVRDGRDMEQFSKVKLERDKLSNHIETFRRNPPDQWTEGELETIGPMVVWENLAEQLERLVERLEH